MDSMQYDRFSSPESESMEQYRNKASSYTLNRQNRWIYIMFGVLTVFLLLLTLTVGIKITQVNQQVAEIFSSLKTVSTSIKAAQTDYLSVHEPEPEVPVPVRGSCDNEWVFYNNKCYYTSAQRLSWNDAEKNCVLRRGHLLVVNDRKEMEFVSKFIEERLNYWIGLVERGGEGDWSWVDGTDFKSSEHFWDEGQPDDWDFRVNGEDCGQIHSVHNPRALTTHRLWNDADCTLRYHYICERPA
ncbi:hepatic lectin-like isoform 1-T4 [Clarias gariepinus]|uniref:hepatic lectin-like n=1 Tax=Clarias gariepinus TaxID=13013 RepID=UPI00234E00DF|nr:hepatic lectin-like [Clarias gariepinus]